MATETIESIEQIKLVLYDFDGVLADSIKPHLQFCMDWALKLECPLDNVPTAEKFREIVKQKRKVFPMENFLRVSGFSEQQIPGLLRDYDSNFRDYEVNLFPGITQLLEHVGKFVDQGIVTANIEKNVSNVLNSNQRFFRKDLIFYSNSGGKSASLNSAIKISRYNPDQILYIGDMEHDRTAAETAGLRFIGAGYGGFEYVKSDEKPGLQIAGSVSELEGMIREFINI